MKIYIVQGSNKVTDSSDSDNWTITHTEYYLLGAYKEKPKAEKVSDLRLSEESEYKIIEVELEI